MPQLIAISIDPVSDNNQGMLRGVLDYVRENPQLRVHKVGAVPYSPLAELQRFRGAGVVCVAETPHEMDLLLKVQVPRVSLSLHLAPPEGLPTVHSDNRAIGRMAAEHLHELGLRRFAFVGHSRWHHDAERWEGFRQGIKSDDACKLVDVRFAGRRQPSTGTTNLDLKHLARELAKLPRPVGIFAAHDEFAHDVVETFAEQGVRVPYDAAVIGVNNNRLICETTDPPLSSIAQAAHRIGYTAASMLHDQIEGRKLAERHVFLPPGALVARRSSDFSAIDDELVIQAVNFIRRRCGHPIVAGDVVAHVKVSRRTLDKRFVAAVGHPAAEEIRLSRIKRARELLVATNDPILQIGMACGYESPSGFVRAFREATGTTPQEHRRRMRMG